MMDNQLCKKAKVSRLVYPRRTTEELWDTVLGNRISLCREDISTGGVNPYSRVQAEFRADFRVPFSLFEEIVVECKEAQIFTTGYKRPIIPDEFKVLTVLRILGRNYVAASVKEIYLVVVCPLLMCGLSGFVSAILIIIILSMYIFLLGLLLLRWRRCIDG